MRARPFMAVDIENIELREHECEIEVRRMAARDWTPAASTLVHDGNIVAIIGYYVLWDGVIEVFVIPSRHLHTCAFQYVRYMKRMVDRLATDDCTLHRIQTRSLADDCTDKWMKLLGFEKEGVLKRFTSNQKDYNMWARLTNHGLR